MIPKRGGPIVKRLRKMIAENPPENIYFWKKPTNTMKQVINNSKMKGRLAKSIYDTEDALRKEYFKKLEREKALRAEQT